MIFNHVSFILHTKSYIPDFSKVGEYDFIHYLNYIQRCIIENNMDLNSIIEDLRSKAEVCKNIEAGDSYSGEADAITEIDNFLNLKTIKVQHTINIINKIKTL